MESQATPENKQKKKTGCIICRIMRWFFIVVLGLLLATGLWFQAPWKILIVLAVIWANLILVPKMLRKWIWLGFAAVIAAVIIWIFIPEKDDGQWKPYAIDKEIAEFNAKHAVPDKDNAALVFEELIKYYKGQWFEGVYFSKIDIKEPNDAFYPDCWTDNLDVITLDQPWKSTDYPEIAKWLNTQKNKQAIELLLQASRKPQCYFVFSTNYWDELFPDRKLLIHKLLQLLSRSANNDWADGRIELAWEKYNATLRLIKFLMEQPDPLLTSSSEGSLIHLRRPLGDFILTASLSETQLLQLDENSKTPPYDNEKALSLIVERRRLIIKQIFSFVYEIHPDGRTRFTRTFKDMLAVTEKMNISFQQPSQYKQKIMAFFSWFYMPATPQAMSEAIDRGCDKVKQEALSNPSWPQKPVRIYLFDDTLPSFQDELFLLYHNRKPYSQRISCLLRLLIALQRYRNGVGDWPDKIEQIKPYTNEYLWIDSPWGKQIVYKCTADGFMLYTTGTNGIDDNGKYDLQTYKDDNLLWPLKIASTEKE